MEASQVIMRDREAHEAIHKKQLEENTTLLEQLALLSKESESGPTMDAHVYQLWIGIWSKESYILSEVESIGMLDRVGDANDNEPIKDIDSVQITCLLEIE